MNLYIKSLKRDVDTGVVKSILWMASKVSADGKHRAESKGEQFLQPKPTDDPSFIDYTSIDLPTAEKWLRESLTEDGLKNTEQYLDAILEQKATQAEALGNPWVPSFDAPQTSEQSVQPRRRTNFPTVQST
jgi:hypothetical protein